MNAYEELAEFARYSFALASFEDEFGTFISGFSAGLIASLSCFSACGELSKERVLELLKEAKEMPNNPGRLAHMLFDQYENSKRVMAMALLDFPLREREARDLRLKIEHIVKAANEPGRKDEVKKEE
jgi:hypothetical protein